MARTKVSSKYQIVIPREIRASMRIRPGMEVEVIELGGIIEIVPVRPPEELKGTLKRFSLAGLRERDRL